MAPPLVQGRRGEGTWLLKPWKRLPRSGGTLGTPIQTGVDQSPFARGVTEEAVQDREFSEWTWTAERGWHNPHSVLREEPLEKGKGKSKEPLQKGKGKGKQPLEKGKGKSKDKGKGKQDEPHQPASSSSSAVPPSQQLQKGANTSFPPSQPLPKGANTSFPPLPKAKPMPRFLSTGTGQMPRPAATTTQTGGYSSSAATGQALLKGPDWWLQLFCWYWTGLAKGP